MSATAETVYQMGLESTPGTAVAATRRVYLRGELPVEDDTTYQFTQSRDNYIANYDQAATHRMVTWKSEEELNFKEAAFDFETIMKGGVSPTGTDPYTRVYNGAASSDDLKAATLECSDNVVDWEVPYLLCKDWEISGADGNGPSAIMFKRNWIGQQKIATTLTSLSDRDIAGSYALFKNTALYLDDSAGGIGGTEVAGLMAFTIKCDNKIQPNFPGNAGGVYTSHNREKRYLEITLDLLLNATTLTEFEDHFIDGDARFGQLDIAGAGDDDLKINFHTKRWHKFEPKASGPTRRVLLMCQTAYDPTLGYDWQATLINNIASIS